MIRLDSSQVNAIALQVSRDFEISFWQFLDYSSENIAERSILTLPPEIVSRKPSPALDHKAIYENLLLVVDFFL